MSTQSIWILLCAGISAMPALSPRAIAQTDFDAQGLVDKLVALQKTIDDKQMSAAMRGEAIANKFDVNDYFTVIDKL